MGQPVAFFEVISSEPKRVDDLDAYLARAAELGGTPLVPPMDLPGNYGLIAIFADPDGNAVGLWA